MAVKSDRISPGTYIIDPGLRNGERISRREWLGIKWRLRKLKQEGLAGCSLPSPRKGYFFVYLRVYTEGDERGLVNKIVNLVEGFYQERTPWV